MWPRIADCCAGLVILGVLALVAMGLATHIDIMWAAQGGQRALSKINAAHKFADTGLWLLISFFAGVLIAASGRRSLGILLTAATVAIALSLAVTLGAMASETVGSERTSLQLAQMNIVLYERIFESIPKNARPFWLAVFIYLKIAVHVSAIIAIVLTKPPRRGIFLKRSALLLTTFSLCSHAMTTTAFMPLVTTFTAHALLGWAGVVSLGFLAVVWLNQSGRVPARKTALTIVLGAGIPLIGFGGSWLGHIPSLGFHVSVGNLSGEEMSYLLVFGAVAAAVIAIGAIVAVWRRLSPPSLIVNPDHF